MAKGFRGKPPYLAAIQPLTRHRSKPERRQKRNLFVQNVATIKSGLALGAPKIKVQVARPCFFDPVISHIYKDLIPKYAAIGGVLLTSNGIHAVSHKNKLPSTRGLRIAANPLIKGSSGLWIKKGLLFPSELLIKV